MPTTLGNIRQAQTPGPNDVYIGRPNASYGLTGSQWANPFLIDTTVGQDREAVVLLYQEWLPTQPHLMAALEELRGKRLLCWCAPDLCHGDVLLAFLGERPYIEASVTPKQLELF